MMNDIDVLLEDGVIESDAWKNLMFMFDGRSMLGYHVHPTEDAAREAAAHGKVLCEHLASININSAIADTHTKKHLYFCREYSHSFQIPWGKK